MADPDIADTFQYNDEDNAFLLIPLILPQFDLEVTYPDTASEEEENGTNQQTRTADISREPDEADDDRLDQVMLAVLTKLCLPKLNVPNEYEDLLQALELVESQNETNQEPEFEDVNIISNGRFPVINTEEKENIVDDANSKSTKKQTKYGVNIFRLVTDPLCEGCVIVDGHAYVAHDSDSSKFYHCYLTHDTNGDEIMVAKEENCAAKTFWSQEHKTCVMGKYSFGPNPLNKCFGQGDGTLMPYLGCETYWMCQGGIPLPMACSNNRIFDPNTLQCITDPGTTNCFGPTLQTCNFEEDPADASKYFVKQQAQDGSVIMIHQTCAPGTLYDQSKCSCSTHDTNIVILPTGCQALVEQGQNGVFTFKQTSELIYGINSNDLVDFQTDPDAMKLTPNGHIIMYRLANYDFQQAFAVSFKLQLSASSPSGLQQILINCIYPETATSLIDTPSISIQVGKSPTGDYTFFSQLQTTDGMQIINVSITGSTSAYVDVTMAYDGNVFVLNVEGQESSIALTGSILKGPTFALGRPLTQPTANGIQYLDAKDIRLYSSGDQGQAECNVTEAIQIKQVGMF
ncbi:unnamed protein product [Mytilus edulis]|uniref:Chitin-binding type-2 domain-containing protein n=1 Tax=Mytilus edulis TaxID=6550 RepID=A0A8S3SPP7_MYTED|nr:unnamed protein product [Mytilus edulis]